MSRITLQITLGLLICTPADAGVPSRKLNRLKDATVLVRVHGESQTNYGAGFLMHRRGEYGLIVTNGQVLGSPRRAGSIDVVFGCGTDTQTILPAKEIVAESVHGLALLEVKATNLPTPIDVRVQAKLREGVVAYYLGFPLSGSDKTLAPNPVVAVDSAVIRRIQNDPRGKPAYSALEGDLDPWTPGGPVVDAEGALIGTAYQGDLGTIANAIAPGRLDALLTGQLRAVTLSQRSNREGVARMDVVAELADPMRNINRVYVHLTPRNALRDKPLPSAAGGYDRIPGDHITLDCSDGQASGAAPLYSSPGTREEFYFQAEFVRRDGSRVTTEPQRFTVAFADASGEGQAESPAVFRFEFDEEGGTKLASRDENPEARERGGSD